MKRYLNLSCLTVVIGLALMAGSESHLGAQITPDPTGAPTHDSNEFEHAHSEDMQSLASSSSLVVGRAVTSLHNERLETIAGLMRTFDSSLSVDSRLAAARLLGDYRATEAVTDLVEHLELEFEIRGVPMNVTGDEYESSYFPD